MLSTFSKILTEYLWGKHQDKEAPPTIEDQIVAMKLQSRMTAQKGKASEKESLKYWSKAKQEQKKNNNQSAKLYMTMFSEKRTQAINFQKMAVKIQLMSDRLKSTKDNQDFVGMTKNTTNAIDQQMKQMSHADMADSIDLLNKKMDQVTFSNKLMNEMMSKDDSIDNPQISEMMDALKQEIHLEENSKLIEDYQHNPHLGQKKVNDYQLKKTINESKKL